MKNRTLALCMVTIMCLLLAMPVNLFAQDEALATEASLPAEDEIAAGPTTVREKKPVQESSETTTQASGGTQPGTTETTTSEVQGSETETSTSDPVPQTTAEGPEASGPTGSLKKSPAAITAWLKLKQKIEAAETNGSSTTITAENDVIADPIQDADRTIEIKAGQHVILQGSRTVKGIGFASIRIAKGASLTLEGIALSNAQIIVEGQLTLNSGKIYDTHLVGPTVFVNQGEFVVNGGEISGNVAEAGQDPQPSELRSLGTFSLYSPITIYSGSFQMNGGSITNNKGFFFGGAIGAWGTATDRSKVVITAGDITGNKAEHPRWNAWGGGLYLNQCDFEMQGGNISENAADFGGGLAVEKSDLTFYGGNITKNTNIDDYKGEGGGIRTIDSDVLIENLNLSNNTANGDGGGISIESSSDDQNFIYIKGGVFNNNAATKDSKASGGALVVRNCKYQIDGGEFSQNSADYMGGAICFVQKSTGTINAGLFTGNQATGNWGGGAILNDNHCTLTIKRALVRNNTIGETYLIGAGDKVASRQGGGIFNCPTGHTEINITNGLALFDNSAPNSEYNNVNNGAGDDFINITPYLYGEIEGKPSTLTLAPRMLGGGYRLWYRDGSFANSWVNWRLSDQTPRYNPDNPGDPLPYNTPIIEGSEKVQLAFKSVPADDSKKLAARVATTIFEANTAYAGRPFSGGPCGGAISNNGQLIFGEQRPYKLKITKAWSGDKAETRPDKILLKMYIGGYEVEDVVLTKAGNWTTTIEDFPDPDTLIDNETGEILPITFAEVGTSSYVLSLKKTEKDEATSTYTIELENKMQVKVEGSKTWNDVDNRDGKRPESIVINLLKNGKKIDSKTVTEADGWKWSFEGLPKYEDDKLVQYSISEETVPGYTSQVKGYDVENIYQPEKTSIKVRKVWQDNENKDGKRPTSIRVRLLADGKAVADQTLTLNSANNWSGEFSDLSAYKDGKKIDYRVEEFDLDRHYTSTISGSAQDGYVITNSCKPERRPKTGENDLPSFQVSAFLLLSAGMLALVRRRRKAEDR